MFDKRLSAPDEVALIKGMSKNFPKSHANGNTVFALIAAYFLNKAIRDANKQP
jgi:hypothetical protein